MAHGKGTKHHKLHSYVGAGTIIGLGPVIMQVSMAAPRRERGFTEWLSTPAGALGFLAFFTAAIWYCKLEFDEVIMDYFDGGTRAFGLLANRIVPFIVWAVTVYAVVKMAFLG
ncbi:hypothetical protein [Fretibacter rubidus]|uniref:hypothetical protein n=1 Tax=Fretibacter rubidus TaxID=570162 RepID=UPI003529E3E6